jgi:hypothetical protein
MCCLAWPSALLAILLGAGCALVLIPKCSSSAEIDPATAGRSRRRRSRLSLDYFKLYTAAHQKLSRRIKDRREILRWNIVNFSWGKRRK